MLTDKAKVDFERWYSDTDSEIKHSLQKSLFYSKTHIERNAYYLEWLDSVGIYVDVQPWADFEDSYTYQKTVFITNVSYIEDKQIKMFDEDSEEEVVTFQTRTQGIEEGIKIANKIYNER